MSEKALKWEIAPATARVVVKNDSVDLGPIFAVTGFTLQGRVVDETG